MSTKQKTFSSIFLIVTVVACLLSYCLGFYKGCIQAIGPNENMGAALSMNCPPAAATIGELIARILPF